MNFHPEAVRKAFRYATSFTSTVGLVANTPETIVAPGSNTLGIVLWEAAILSANLAGPTQLALLAKSSAPANTQDGDALITAESAAIGGATTAFYTWGVLRHPVFIAAGKGLYNIVSTTEGVIASRRALYTVLA